MIKTLRLSRKRARKAATAASSVQRFFSALGRADDLNCARLWSSWEDVLGQPLATMARPLRKRGATLVLGMDDPIVGQELSFFAPQILERVNAFLGRKIFDKVAFELLEGQVPLDEMGAGRAQRGVFVPQRPQDLGRLPAPEGAVGKAYRAYIRRFAEAKAGTGEKTP